MKHGDGVWCGPEEEPELLGRYRFIFPFSLHSEMLEWNLSSLSLEH